MKAGENVARVALTIPEKPTNGDILRALAEAEAAGFERAQTFADARMVATLERVNARVKALFAN
jgi:hypothetical protein